LLRIIACTLMCSELGERQASTPISKLTMKRITRISTTQKHPCNTINTGILVTIIRRPCPCNRSFSQSLNRPRCIEAKQNSNRNAIYDHMFISLLSLPLPRRPAPYSCSFASSKRSSISRFSSLPKAADLKSSIRLSSLSFMFWNAETSG
jgi:hypothetical protein